MANKKNWFGILAMVLVFGMTIVGCDHKNGSNGNSSEKGGDNVNPFVGTWYYSNSYGTLTITFNAGGTFVHKNGMNSYSGTYSHNGNSANLSAQGGKSTATIGSDGKLNFGGVKYTKR